MHILREQLLAAKPTKGLWGQGCTAGQYKSSSAAILPFTPARGRLEANPVLHHIVPLGWACALAAMYVTDDGLQRMVDDVERLKAYLGSLPTYGRSPMDSDGDTASMIAWWPGNLMLGPERISARDGGTEPGNKYDVHAARMRRAWGAMPKYKWGRGSAYAALHRTRRSPKLRDHMQKGMGRTGLLQDLNDAVRHTETPTHQLMGTYKNLLLDPRLGGAAYHDPWAAAASFRHTTWGRVGPSARDNAVTEARRRQAAQDLAVRQYEIRRENDDEAGDNESGDEGGPFGNLEGFGD